MSHLLIRRSVAILLLAAFGAVAIGGCSASLTSEPGTVGGTIAALEASAADHDWETYASYWDLEAVGVTYADESGLVAESMWFDTLGDTPMTESEVQTREHYPEGVLLTRESFELALLEYVEAGAEDPTRGIGDLISLDNVTSARVREDVARITFEAEGHLPDKLVLEFWRVVDGPEQKWIVGYIVNGKDVAKSQAAF